MMLRGSFKLAASNIFAQGRAVPSPFPSPIGWLDHRTLKRPCPAAGWEIVREVIPPARMIRACRLLIVVRLSSFGIYGIRCVQPADFVNGFGVSSLVNKGHLSPITIASAARGSKPLPATGLQRACAMLSSHTSASRRFHALDAQRYSSDLSSCVLPGRLLRWYNNSIGGDPYSLFRNYSVCERVAASAGTELGAAHQIALQTDRGEGVRHDS
jgi:hypothetical protein